MGVYYRPYEHMSDFDLEESFLPGRWGSAFTTDEKLQLMQELECRMAAKTGRTARTVVLYDKGEEKASNGYWCEADGKIHINDLLVEKGQLVYYNESTNMPESTFRVDYSGVMIYNTVVHEGTHAWDTERSLPQNYRDSEELRDICINSAHYKGKSNYQNPEKDYELYLIQPTELHANSVGYGETLEMLDRHPDHVLHKQMKDHVQQYQTRCSRSYAEQQAKVNNKDDKIVEKQREKMLDNAIEMEAQKMADQRDSYVPCKYLRKEELERAARRSAEIADKRWWNSVEYVGAQQGTSAGVSSGQPNTRTEVRSPQEPKGYRRPTEAGSGQTNGGYQRPEPKQTDSTKRGRSR